MKRFVLVILSILFLVLDNTVMPFISIKGYFPSVLFTFAILFSLVNGYWEAVFMGAFSGLLQDVYFLNIFGVNALTNLLLCLVAAYIGENILKQKKLIPVILNFILTMVKFILVYFIYKLAKIKMNLDGIFIMGLYNMVIAFIMYSWVYTISNKAYMKTEWKFNEK